MLVTHQHKDDAYSDTSGL